ncbi:MAG TPA: PqqD family protein [Methylovirgula sp.]|nr:PqqD family protein [Methylovirgula sp.]
MLPGTSFIKSSDWQAVEVDDGVVVKDARSDEVHFLNRTAAIVYEMCDGQATPAQMARFLEEAFGLKTSALSDVHACLETLERKNLIRKV